MKLNSDSGVAVVESPDVEYAGRRYPQDWEQFSASPKNRIRKLAPLPQSGAEPRQFERTAEPQPDDLVELIAHEILSRLPWTRLPSSVPSVQPLVEAYVTSLNQMDRFRADVDTLIRVACEGNLEFRQQAGATHGQARDEALQSKLGEMLSAASGDWLPTRNIIDAHLVARPVGELRQHLDANLNQAVRKFGQQFVELLARLVDRELFGLVEWLPNSCCSYHFFKRLLIQENQGASTSTVETRLAGEATRDAVSGGRIIGTRTTTATRGRGRHQHRLARHQHDVMNAFHTSIQNSQVVMPPQVVRLCKAVPEWLQPLVRVIDGTIFRERIVERDTGVTNWEDTTIRSEPIVIRDEPIVGYEPGIVIGPYVLTGWGPREVRAEQQRREVAQQRQHAESCAEVAAVERIGWTVGFLLTAAGGVMLYHGAVADSSPFWGVVTMLASLLAMTQVVRSRGQAELHSTNVAHYLTGLVSASGLIAALMLFGFCFRYDRLGDGAWGVGMLIATGIVWVLGNRVLWSSSK